MSIAVLMELNKENLIQITLSLITGDDKESKRYGNRHDIVQFDIALRILPLTEVVYPEKLRIDGEAYTILQKASKVSSISKDFSAFHRLKQILEKNGVFCSQKDLHEYEESSQRLASSDCVECSVSKTLCSTCFIRFITE
jgi:hypothetical protein